MEVKIGQTIDQTLDQLLRRLSSRRILIRVVTYLLDEIRECQKCINSLDRGKNVTKESNLIPHSQNLPIDECWESSSTRNGKGDGDDHDNVCSPTETRRAGRSKATMNIPPKDEEDYRDTQMNNEKKSSNEIDGQNFATLNQILSASLNFGNKRKRPQEHYEGIPISIILSSSLSTPSIDLEGLRGRKMASSRRVNLFGNLRITERPDEEMREEIFHNDNEPPGHDDNDGDNEEDEDEDEDDLVILI
ncbi:hypothetical protein M231_01634 [Tremella mesenterica]|uniref:Uncharacterized protein n=1 Tax=Tremella mesenterica TaxID=5217 RepID=A0A4Q1BSJ1_TREME|nr:hypothetical protein M231_01634 [Tremella mesenterica]